MERSERPEEDELMSLDKVEQNLIQIFRELDDTQKEKFLEAFCMFSSMFSHPKSDALRKGMGCKEIVCLNCNRTA
jgi:hypothetical protein